MTIAVYGCSNGAAHPNIPVEVATVVTLSQVTVLCPKCNMKMERID